MIKKIYRGLDNYYAKWKLRKNTRVNISNDATVNYRTITIIQDCKLNIGKESIIEANLIFEKPKAEIIIGDRTFIGGSSIISSLKVEFGNDVLVAWGCVFLDHNSHSIQFHERRDDVIHWRRGHKEWNNVKSKPIKINDKAWIGFNCIILKGVTVGEGAIIGAGSVVTKDVSPYTMVAGNPAKFVKLLDKNEQ